MYLHFIMKKLEINMKLHPTTDSETHGNGDSPDQQMLPCYICGKLYHSGEVNVVYDVMLHALNILLPFAHDDTDINIAMYV